MESPERTSENAASSYTGANADWKEKRQAERDGMFRMIDNTARKIAADLTMFLSFLNTLSNISRYSISNAIAVFCQYPGAAKLKSYDDWTAQNCYVRKGERGISIFEPEAYIKTDGSTGTAFKLTKLFDISQTSCREFPELKPETKGVIASMLDNAPVDAKLADDIPGFLDCMSALYDSSKKTIYVKRNIGDVTELFQSVALELAHAELAEKTTAYSRKAMGFPAAAAAYMLSIKYGIDTSNFSLGAFPDEWRKSEPTEIRERLNVIREVFNNIVGYISKAKPQTTEGV